MMHFKVKKFSTIFMFPFVMEERKDRIKKGDDLPIYNGNLNWEEKPYEKEKYWQEYIYFHSYVREALLTYGKDQNKKNNILLRTYLAFDKNEKDNENESMFEVELFDSDNSYKFNITYLVLHKFEPDIFILSFQIEYVQNDLNQVCFKDVLDFNNLSRLLYPSYEEQVEYQNIALRIKFMIKDFYSYHCFIDSNNVSKPDYDDKHPKINNVICSIIHSFFNSGNIEIENKPNFEDRYILPILDDRMFVNTFVSLDIPDDLKNHLLQDYDNKVLRGFSRLLYVDKHGSDWQYYESFIREEMESHLYRRWQHLGSIYGFTRYSIAYLVFSDNDDPNKGFNNKTFYKHFKTMYYQIALLGLFYRTQLVYFSLRITKATEDIIEENKRKKFRKISSDFIEFSNMYWFLELTNQDQGIEMTDTMYESFQIPKLYKEVEAEINRTYQYLKDEFIEKVNRWGILVAIVALFFEGSSFIVGFLSVPGEYPGFWQVFFPYFKGIYLIAIIIFLVYILILYKLDKYDKDT